MNVGLGDIEKVWGALVAGAGAGAFLWRYRKRILLALGAPKRFIIRISTALDSIEKVRGEVFKNGGSSLRDAVDLGNLGVSKLSGLFCLQTDLSGRVAFICDETGRCTYVSDGWRNLTGLTNEEASGFRWAGALHPEDRARVIASWHAAIADGTVFRDRYRYRHRQTGDVATVEVRASPVYVGGRVVCFYGQATVTDVVTADDVDATFPPSPRAAGGRHP